MSLRETPIDPSASSRLIQRAFLIEAILNLCSFPIITHTRSVLSFVLLHPSDVNASTVLFARLFGAVVIGGLTPPLLLGARDTREAVESRSRTYTLLGLGEVLMIPLLAQQALMEDGALEKAVGSGLVGGDKALSTKAAVLAMGMLLPPLLFRVWAMFIRPGGLGSVAREKKA